MLTDIHVDYPTSLVIHTESGETILTGSDRSNKIYKVEGSYNLSTTRG